MQTVDVQTKQQQVLLAQTQVTGRIRQQVATFRQPLANEYAAGMHAHCKRMTLCDGCKPYKHTLPAWPVQQQAPNYRDVERLLAQVQPHRNANSFSATAETAYQAQQWSAAVQAYEALRQLDSTYAADVVVPHLAVAYLYAGPADCCPTA